MQTLNHDETPPRFTHHWNGHRFVHRALPAAKVLADLAEDRTLHALRTWSDYEAAAA